jgi:hypothetical protein
MNLRELMMGVKGFAPSESLSLPKPEVVPLKHSNTTIPMNTINANAEKVTTVTAGKIHAVAVTSVKLMNSIITPPSSVYGNETDTSNRAHRSQDLEDGELTDEGEVTTKAGEMPNTKRKAVTSANAKKKHRSRKAEKVAFKAGKLADANAKGQRAAGRKKIEKRPGKNLKENNEATDPVSKGMDTIEEADQGLDAVLAELMGETVTPLPTPPSAGSTPDPSTSISIDQTTSLTETQLRFANREKALTRSLARTRKLPCNRWKQFKCTLGTECKFSHDCPGGDPRSNVLCRFAPSGSCIVFGCPFSHKTWKFPCAFFHFKGGCRFKRGGECRVGDDRAKNVDVKGKGEERGGDGQMDEQEMCAFSHAPMTDEQREQFLREDESFKEKRSQAVASK